MKKLFLLWVLIFSTSTLFGAYDIKLGVFKNVKNLRVNIAKIKPYTLRKQIIIKNKKGFYYTHATVSGSRSQADKALKAYRRIFKDAFIAGKIKEHHKVKKKLRKKKIKHVKKIKPIAKIVPVEVATMKTLDAKLLLKNKTVYLCYEDGPAHLEKRIVQMVFNENTISYIPLDKKEALEIDYSIKNSSVLLKLSDITMIHKIIEKKETYLAVESYVGSKKMHTLRYYFNQEDALKFLK